MDTDSSEKGMTIDGERDPVTRELTSLTFTKFSPDQEALFSCIIDAFYRDAVNGEPFKITVVQPVIGREIDYHSPSKQDFETLVKTQ